MFRESILLLKSSYHSRIVIVHLSHGERRTGLPPLQAETGCLLVTEITYRAVTGCGGEALRQRISEKFN